MTSHNPDEQTPNRSDHGASGLMKQYFTAQDRVRALLLHPTTLDESHPIQHPNLCDEHDTSSDLETSTNTSSRKSLSMRNALNRNHASKSGGNSPKMWNGALVKVKKSLSRLGSKSLSVRDALNRNRNDVSKSGETSPETWKGALIKVKRSLCRLKSKSIHMSRLNTIDSNQFSGQELHNMVCRGFVKYSQAKKLRVSLGAWHNDIVGSCALIEKHRMTEPHPQAPAGHGNAYNQVLMASNDPKDREYVFMKHTVASVLTSKMERWRCEQVSLPDVRYAHSLWNIISSHESGLRSQSMTEARTWLAHAFRAEESVGGDQGDHIIFSRIFNILRQILPAVKATKNKLDKALKDTKAWVPDVYKVSDEPDYTRDCPEAEFSRQQLLATTERKPGDTGRQLELKWASLRIDPSAAALLPEERVGWDDTPQESMETTSGQSQEVEGTTSEDAQETDWDPQGLLWMGSGRSSRRNSI